MTTRRSFLKTTTVLSAGMLLTKSPGCNAKNTLIGLQLYTVRDAMAKDPEGTLAKVAQIGYTSVETATYTGTEKFYGMSPRDFAAVIKKNGLVVPSGHYRLGEETPKGEVQQGTILHDWDKAVDDAAAVGLKYMVCAYLSTDERGDLDHYKKVAQQLNTAGERCKKAGIQLCYHNHDFEFIKQNDQ
nr:sugar phosphate isomerase/epimerase [Bacteroidota bacterium]